MSWNLLSEQLTVNFLFGEGARWPKERLKDNIKNIGLKYGYK